MKRCHAVTAGKIRAPAAAREQGFEDVFEDQAVHRVAEFPPTEGLAALAAQHHGAAAVLLDRHAARGVGFACGIIIRDSSRGFEGS